MTPQPAYGSNQQGVCEACFHKLAQRSVGDKAKPSRVSPKGPAALLRLRELRAATMTSSAGTAISCSWSKSSSK
eukprot:m.218797 g.218797  ORF g.218797 m.218797 type:complete len:74 (-) comp17225_c1_seq2:1257-1478(-)